MSIFTNINNYIDIELRKRVVKYINMLADTNTDINNLQIQFCINKKYIKTSGNLLYSLKQNPYMIKVPGYKYNVPDMTLIIYPEYEWLYTYHDLKFKI